MLEKNLGTSVKVLVYLLVILAISAALFEGFWYVLLHANFIVLVLACIVWIYVKGINRISENEQVKDLLKKYETFVKKEFFKIGPIPVATSNIDVLNRIYSPFEGKKYVQMSLALSKDKYDENIIFLALKKLAKVDYSDVWKDVHIVSGKIKHDVIKKNKRVDMMTCSIVLEVPKDVRPQIRCPYNGYRHVLLHHFAEVIPVERV